MSRALTENKIYDQINFQQIPLVKGEYENCRFINCDLSNINLSESIFIDCSFVSCNLSLIKLGDTVFRDVHFNECKMLGLHLEDCNEFGLMFSFEKCSLNHSSFFQTKIRKTIFTDCQLQETDFTEADISGCVFKDCDLLKAKFEHTIMEKTDFRSAYNYSIDPEMNKIKKAMFSQAGIKGLLDKYDIKIE